jgi:hypothetical protein
MLATYGVGAPHFPSIIGSGADVGVSFVEGHEPLEPELLESVFVEMDPVVDGFAGVFVELVRLGERYVLRQTAAVSGNRLVEIHLSSERLAIALFEKNTTGYATRGS